MSRSSMSRLFACLLLALSAIACGADDDDRSAVASSAATTPSDRPSGEPLVLSIIGDYTIEGDDQRQLVVGAEAAAAAINEAGGIGGRPIEILACDSKEDPNEAAQCARQAVDAGAVASVGNITFQAASVLPILEEAGIAVIGNAPFDPADLASPVAYPLSGGIASTFVGMATLLADEGSERIHTVYFDIDVGALAFELVKLGLASRGLADNGSTPLPPGTTDLSPQVASALESDPDGIVLAMPGEEVAKFVRAMRQAGADVRVAVLAESLSEENLEALGEAAEGIYAANGFLPVSAGGPGAEQFRAEMDAVDSDARQDDVAINAWLSVRLFAQVAQNLPVIDRGTVLAAMDHVEGADMFGFIPPFSTTAPVEAVPGVTRLFNSTVVYTQVHNGVLEVISADFVNPFAAPS